MVTPQQEFNKALVKELFKMTMSWDNELREWYPIAIKSLDFASAITTGVPQQEFAKLYETTRHGPNMNVVRVLCNCVQKRTAHEMGMPGKEWAQFLIINANVSKRWNELSRPLQEKLLRQLEIMNVNDSQLTIAQA